MTEREKLLKEINDFYKNGYAQAVGGKMTELGMFSGEVKGLFKKKPYGVGFLLDDDGVIYKDFFSEKPSHFPGTECKENEYIKIYKTLGETKIYTSEKIILPNGCFVGSVNMMTGEHIGEYFDDDGTVYNGGFAAKVFSKMMKSVAKENVISSENEKNIFTVSYANGDKYVGLLNNGLKNGKGELTLKSGEKISGIFENDKNPGAVKSVEPNAQNSNAQNENAKTSTQNASSQKQNNDANAINGKFAKNASANYVVSMKFNGNTYTGEIKNNLPNGFGEAIFANQDKYKGEWLNGKLNGKGTYNFLNGEQYEGDFLNGQMNGKGTYTTISGTKYVGSFVSNKKQGQGEMSWKNGDNYIGEFADDMINGKGTYIFKDGRKYVGEFVNNKKQGHGTFTWENGDQYEGEFARDRRNGKGVMTWKNGTKFEGEFVDDVISGKGTMFWANGIISKGEFKDENENGLCAIIDPVQNCLIYGNFKNGNLNGKAYIHNKYGKCFEVQCNNVEPIEIYISGYNQIDGTIVGDYGLKKLWGKQIDELENELKKQVEILNKKSAELLEKEFAESDFNKMFLEEWNNHSK